MESSARRRVSSGQYWRRHVGGAAPIVVQSMTNTDTADIEATAAQVAALARAGSELVRITVDRDEAAAAVPHIREQARCPRRRRCRSSATSTITATLCSPSIRLAREALAKYRINPGNVGFKDKRDRQFSAIIEIAIQQRQAGAHRRELGKPRPGSAHPADGRECEAARAEGRPRGDA